MNTGPLGTRSKCILHSGTPGPPAFNGIQALNTQKRVRPVAVGGAPQRAEKGLQANNMGGGRRDPE